ncbi:hypothetical protein D9M68_604330 [compost metagenome]
MDVQVAVHHLDAEPGLQRTAGAKGVAEEALLRADRHARAEQAAGGQGLGDVALFGGGAVAVDVADSIGLQVGVFQGQLHGAAHGGVLRLGGVLAIGVTAEADDFGMDFRPARQGVLQLFQHQHAGAFADHQAIATAVVGAWRGVRRVVLQAGGVQRVEDHGFGRAKLFRAAGEHQWQAAELDCLVGVADALAAAGAGTGSGDQPALEAEEDADIRRRGVRHHAHVGVGVEAVGHRVEQHIAERLDLVGAASGRAAGHAHAAIADTGGAEQPGIFQRTFGGIDRQLGHPAHAAQLLAGPVPGHREVIDRSAETGVQFAEAIPLIHAADAASIGAEIRLDARPVAAQRGDAGHAGDYDSFHQHNPPFTERTWRVM